MSFPSSGPFSASYAEGIQDVEERETDVGISKRVII